MEKVMENLGLEPKPETGVAASSGKPPSGFVQAEAPTPTQTPQILEKETLTLHMDPTTETFTIEGWAPLVPALPHSAAKYFRDITHGELRSLLDAFRSSPWTASLVVKIAEVYHISKREAVHTQMLKLRHTTQRGGSMVNLKEADPGTSPQLVCSDCNAPWGKLSKCLLCQGSQPVDLSVTPLSVIEVAGQSWQLRLTEAGPTWVPTDTKVTKASGFVEVGDLGRPPPAAASGAGMGLVSFSEQVPASQRLTLQQHVVAFGQDEIFHPDGARPPTMDDRDSTQTAVIFHPKTIELMRFKADLLATPEEELTEAAQEAKKRKKEIQHQQETVAMEDELHTLTAIQQCAQETQNPVSAKMLRHADLQQFRSYLKRKHEESGLTSSYEALVAAQTTQDKAAAANKALDTEFRDRRLRLSSPSTWRPSHFGPQLCKRRGRAISSRRPTTFFVLIGQRQLGPSVALFFSHFGHGNPRRLLQGSPASSYDPLQSFSSSCSTTPRSSPALTTLPPIGGVPVMLVHTRMMGPTLGGGLRTVRTRQRNRPGGSITRYPSKTIHGLTRMVIQPDALRPSRCLAHWFLPTSFWLWVGNLCFVPVSASFQTIKAMSLPCWTRRRSICLPQPS